MSKTWERYTYSYIEESNFTNQILCKWDHTKICYHQTEDRILKDVKENKHITDKGILVNIAAYFSVESTEATGEWDCILQTLKVEKKRNCQLGGLYPTKSFLKK